MKVACKQQGDSNGPKSSRNFVVQTADSVRIFLNDRVESADETKRLSGQFMVQRRETKRSFKTDLQ